MQLAARTPANAAMSAATDRRARRRRALHRRASGCRVRRSSRAGMANPGAAPIGAPGTTSPSCARYSAARPRSAHEGREISLPYHGAGPSGIGKPLKSILHMRPDIPIYLGTGTEATVSSTAEIADGWLPTRLRTRLDAGVPALARGGLPAQQRQAQFQHLRNPRLGPRRNQQRRQGGVGQAQARGGALRRRHGPSRQELSQGHHGSTWIAKQPSASRIFT